MARGGIDTNERKRHNVPCRKPRKGNAYGQINLRHPFYLVHAIEEIPEEEGERFDAL